MSCANRRPPRPRSRPAAWRRLRSATRWQSWSPRRRPIVTRPPHARLTPSAAIAATPGDQRAQRRRRGRDLAHIRGAASGPAAGEITVAIEWPRRGRHVDRHPGPGSGDEIGRMAQALGVFRDTAVEDRAEQPPRDRAGPPAVDRRPRVSQRASFCSMPRTGWWCATTASRQLYPGLADVVVPGLRSNRSFGPWPSVASSRVWPTETKTGLGATRTASQRRDRSCTVSATWSPDQRAQDPGRRHGRRLHRRDRAQAGPRRRCAKRRRSWR